MNSIEVKSDSVMAMFAELDEKRRKQVFRGAMNKASAILVNETKRGLRQSVSRTKTKRANNKNRSLEQGVRKKVARDSKSVKIHIMGDFRLKLFEMGTKDRRTRSHKRAGQGRNVTRAGKGGFRGRNTASYFFKNAKQAKEKEVFSTLDQIISKEIERINRKYLNR